MKTKTLKAALSIFIAFSLALSSCDKKNAGLVNRRTATPEKIEEIKEAQKSKGRRRSIGKISSSISARRNKRSIKNKNRIRRANTTQPAPVAEPEHTIGYIRRVHGKGHMVWVGVAEIA
ncbi:hypothetical protein AGMMS49936_02980 [Endomicrobiia bacterium]|nr:hypothetical protein AGMMS49936_02980 [Endomicrobiia bacterium]